MYYCKSLIRPTYIRQYVVRKDSRILSDAVVILFSFFFFFCIYIFWRYRNYSKEFTHSLLMHVYNNVKDSLYNEVHFIITYFCCLLWHFVKVTPLCAALSYWNERKYFVFCYACGNHCFCDMSINEICQNESNAQKFEVVTHTMSSNICSFFFFF